MIGWRELLIVLVIVVVIFGAKKLKNIGKDLGGAVGGFKEGLKEGQDNARLGNDGDANGTGDAASRAKADSRGDGGQG